MARLAAGAGGTAIQAAVRAVALEDSGPSCPVSHGEPRDLGRLQCVIPLDRSTRPTVQADSAVYSHARRAPATIRPRSGSFSRSSSPPVSPPCSSSGSSPPTCPRSGAGSPWPGCAAAIRMSILAVAPGRPVAGQAGSINVDGAPRRSHTRAFTPSRRPVRGLRQAGHRLPWPARPGPSPPWGSPALPPDRRSKLPGFRDSRPRAESTMGAPARTANTIEGGRGKRVGLGHRPPDEK